MKWRIYNWPIGWLVFWMYVEFNKINFIEDIKASANLIYHKENGFKLANKTPGLIYLSTPKFRFAASLSVH